MGHSKPVRLKTAPTVLPFGRHCFQQCRCGVVRKPHLPGGESVYLFLEFTINNPSFSFNHYLTIQRLIGYTNRMKVKTSITLSEDLIKEIDVLLGEFGNRSAFVEQVLRDFLAAKARRFDAAKELEILNRFADELNEEAADTLSYQVKW